MEVKRGDIWIVNLDPTIGHEIKKSRPAVIIQNDIGNKYSPVTIVAPVSSQNLSKIYPIEVLLTPKNSGLEKESKVLLNQMRTVDKERLVQRIGKVNEETMVRVNRAIKISIGV